MMYVNYGNLNPHRQYTYLRSYDDELLLIAVNFDNSPCHIAIQIPPLAFTCMKIKQGNFNGSELLAGHKRNYRLAIGEPFDTDIPANGAVIWKLVPDKEMPHGNETSDGDTASGD